MEYKKSIIIILLAIFLVSIASVSAADADDTTIASENNLEIDQTTGDVIGAGEDTELSSYDVNEILGADKQTFAGLNATINGNTNKDIYLNGYYKYSNGDDSFKKGIVINRDVNIYGNGSVIDGNNETRIFQIDGGNVVFYNITFVNGNAGDEWGDNGGAINGNCKAINCTFTANHAYRGGAIYAGSAVNCSFSGNNATMDGGAMYAGSAVNCSFSGNTAEYGGAMVDGSAVNCSFSGNNASMDGGAMFRGSAVNCSFSGNNASMDGGAMFGGSAVNCSFSGNTATCGGAMFGCYKMNCTGQNPEDYESTENLVLHWDANNFTTGYGSAEELPLRLMNQNDDSIDFINYDVVIYKDGSEVKTYHCLSNYGPSIDLPVGIYTAEMTVTYPGIDKPEAKNITLTVTDGTTFSDLNKAINGNTNDTITLDKDYAFNSTVDSAFTEGIVINRHVTIIGNGYTINANGKARIFNVKSDDVVLEDISFINANSAGDGGAVHFAKSGSVINCNFTNNQATRIYHDGTGDGGAVYFAKSGSVINCNFTNNTAGKYGGGAVYFKSNGTVLNCNFADNKVPGDISDGGAIWINSGTVENCNFANNSALGGGAIRFGNGNVTNCNFTDNQAGIRSGAILMDSGSVTNCNFTNNKATGEYSYGGGAISMYSGTVINCNFTNNTANSGGAIYFYEYSNGNVTNCNFTNNNASHGGAIYFGDLSTGSVTNCNFTNNSANYGGAIYFLESLYEYSNGNVANCNFINNSAEYYIYDNDIYGGYGGAISMYSGTVTNCNFTNNQAIGEGGGGAISMYSGTVENCNFINNSAEYYVYDNNIYGGGGGAINMDSGSVENCNFTNNKATGEYSYGGAVYFDNWDSSNTLSISNSIFLNNRANAEALDVVKNDNNITITFTGKNDFLNAIYSMNDGGLTFTNVTYWGANGIANTGSSPTTPSRSNKAAGQNITVGVVVNDVVVLNEVKVTDENGTIVLDMKIDGDYLIRVCHNLDSYYTQAETILSNMTFNVNLTSQTSNNRTVNITAKSDIPQDIVQGKLLFILPNGFEINATYASNGTWWAVNTFDDYKDYQLNASYIGLDNVTITNATISIVKANSTVNVSDVVLTYGESKELTVTTTGATGITAKIDNDPVSVINNYTIPISGLNVGNYTLTVTTIPDDDHNPATKTVNITVNKAATEIILTNETLYLKAGDMVSDLAKLTPGDAGNLTFHSSNEDIAIAYDGTILAHVKGNVTVTVSFAGNDYYAPAVNKTITVYVSPKDANVSVENETLDLNVDDRYEFNPTVNPSLLAVQYSSSNESVAVVTDYGLLCAVGEGTAIITLTVGNDQTYAINTTNVTVKVSKVPTEISLANLTVDLYVLDEIGSGATLTPADAGNLTYTSGNESVAIVKDGKIIAVGAGKAVITVSFAGDDKYAAAEDKTVTVTVSLKEATVTVNNSTLDLFVGDNFTVVATTVPDGLNVTFVPDDSGVYSVDDKGVVTALKEGTGNILVKVGGDGVYAENSTTVAVTVSKVPTEIVLSSPTGEMSVGAMGHVAAELNPSEAGNLSYASNDTTVVSVSSTGVIKANKVGTAIITVSFNGTDKYAACESRNITITVNLKDATVTVNNATLNLFVGDNFTVVATTVPDGLNVTFVPDNSGVYSVDDKGVVTALKEGTGNILVKVGDGKVYAENSTNVTVSVKKIPTEILIQNATVELEVNDSFDPVVSLMPSGAGLIGFKSSDDSVALVNSDGEIFAVGEGDATITAYFTGNEKYAACESKNITVRVSLKDAGVSVNNATLNLFVGDNFTVVATTVPDGLNVTFVPDNSGVYSVDDKGVVTALKEGTGNILVKVGDGKVYAENSTAVTVTVSKIPTEIVSSAVSTVYNTGKNLTVTLKDAFGKPISGANITVDLNGAKTYTTDEKGQVKVSTKALVPKTYTANITFNGNDKYKQSAGDVKVTVKKATPKITADTKTFRTTTKTKKYTITLKDNRGKAIRKATVYLKVGGKTYKAVTNSKGKATFKITKLNKKGTFKATVSYKGNKYYNKATKKSKIKVITTFKTVSKGSKDKTTVKEIQRALKNNGYYLTAHGHYLKVDGIYHDYTVKAVKQFQKAKGLKVTGQVDEKTAKKLKII